MKEFFAQVGPSLIFLGLSLLAAACLCAAPGFFNMSPDATAGVIAGSPIFAVPVLQAVLQVYMDVTDWKDS